MSGLEARRIAELTPANLKLVLDDMGARPGWNASGDLYAWYCSMAKEDGLEPVSQRKFSDTLKALGYRSATQRVAGVPRRCWFMTMRAFRGGAVPREI